MRELVIGATGFIGQALCQQLPEAARTARRVGPYEAYLDLADFRDNNLPACDIAYVCAGANGAKACEGNQESFRVNVDAPIEIARVVAARGGFTVWISSMSVEWLGGAYQRQKLAAECALRPLHTVGIVRAGRVTRDNVADLCRTLVEVGRNRISGVTRWGTDDIAYVK